MMKTKKMTNITMFVAIAIIFHMVEGMIPIPIPIPGFKLGLANIVGLIALYMYGSNVMLGVNFMRVIIASLLHGIIFGTGFWLSLSGVIFSCLAAIIAKQKTPMSIYGVSIASSVFHVIGQMIAVTFIYEQFLMGAILPILIVLSIPTGISVGYISQMVLKRIK